VLLAVQPTLSRAPPFLHIADSVLISPVFRGYTLAVDPAVAAHPLHPRMLSTSGRRANSLSVATTAALMSMTLRDCRPALTSARTLSSGWQLLNQPEPPSLQPTPVAMLRRRAFACRLHYEHAHNPRLGPLRLHPCATQVWDEQRSSRRIF
jgi:hypothetical protein